MKYIKKNEIKDITIKDISWWNVLGGIVGVIILYVFLYKLYLLTFKLTTY